MNTKLALICCGASFVAIRIEFTVCRGGRTTFQCVTYLPACASCFFFCFFLKIIYAEGSDLKKNAQNMPDLLVSCPATILCSVWSTSPLFVSCRRALLQHIIYPFDVVTFFVPVFARVILTATAICSVMATCMSMSTINSCAKHAYKESDRVVWGELCVRINKIITGIWSVTDASLV